MEPLISGERLREALLDWARSEAKAAEALAEAMNSAEDGAESAHYFDGQAAAYRRVAGLLADQGFGLTETGVPDGT